MASAELNDVPQINMPRRISARLLSRARQNIVQLTIWVVWALIVGAVGLYAYQAGGTLGRPAEITGYALFAVMLALGMFNLRKRLPMVPLVRARWWTAMHLSGGIAAFALLVLHVGLRWPTGVSEQVLMLLFYGVTVSGLVGWLIVRITPARLTQTGVEVIFERIPTELAVLREAAEALMVRAAAETGSDTLARVYLESFAWFFRRPRFQLSHIWGGRRGSAWIYRSIDTARRYMNEDERKLLDELRALAVLKNRLDFHYVAQGLTKVWLLLHVPLAVAVLALATWHLIIVNAYIL
ncbi:MAG: hypothetical protein ACI8W7_000059 [Gammaproteobacteria bacterium]